MNEEVMAGIFILVCAGIAFFLFTRWWFWALAFGLGGLASFFSVCASVIHFQILAAVGFSVLTFLCYLGLGFSLTRSPY